MCDNCTPAPLPRPGPRLGSREFAAHVKERNAMTLTRQDQDRLAFAAFAANYDRRDLAVKRWPMESPFSQNLYKRQAMAVVEKVREIELEKELHE